MTHDQQGQDGGGPCARDKREAAVHYLRSLSEELTSLSSAVEALIRNPGPVDSHFYAEGIRLAGVAASRATEGRDHLVGVAIREPDRISIRRAAELSNISVNTIRNLRGMNPKNTSPGRNLGEPVF